MKRLILYSLLNSEKLENILYEYENKGYILYKVKWRYIFYFRKRITNTVGRYLSLYLLPRDARAFELDNKIAHSSANEVPTYFSNIVFYRYTIKDRDIENIILLRNKYIKYVYFVWMIVNAVISFSLLFCFVLSVYHRVAIIKTIMFGVLLGCFFAFFILFTIRFFKSRIK